MPRGGWRPGSGRPKGSRNRYGAADRRRLGEAATRAAEEALGILLEIAREGSSELARVAAAREIVALTFGRDPRLADYAKEPEPPLLDLLALVRAAAPAPEAELEPALPEPAPAGVPDAPASGAALVAVERGLEPAQGDQPAAGAPLLCAAPGGSSGPSRQGPEPGARGPGTPAGLQARPGARGEGR